MSENYIVHGYNFAGHETGHRAKYPTANLYFKQMWQAKEALDKEAAREDSPFPAMIVTMKTKLEKYWKFSWLALSIPVILDPRFKFTYLEFRLLRCLLAVPQLSLQKLRRYLECDLRSMLS
jgi:hypothetical protein